MTARVAINGFGRIGRLAVRALCEQAAPDLQLVAINSPGDVAGAAHLLAFDSIHGRFAGTVLPAAAALVINGISVPYSRHKDSAALRWDGVDVLLECSGKFTKAADAQAHLQAGARRVLISAPAEGEDITIVMGVNHDQLRPAHRLVSMASCTTNCLAPVAQVLHAALGIERGFMTTIHAYTGDQNLVDGSHKDPRRARAAALSIIPSSSGVAKAIGRVLPELAGRLDGTALRVPVANVSAIDLTFTASQPTDVAAVNAVLCAAAAGSHRDILAVTDLPLVSVDLNHSRASATVALDETRVVDGRLVRVLAWYDNEWAFAHRMLELARLLAD